MAASALLSSLCLAAVFAVPEMPEAEWDDTEVVDCAAGDEVREHGAEGRASLEWRLVFGAVNAPRSLSATADGRAAFSALAAHPPRFLYSPEWDTVRVVCRGMDSPSPSISGFIENIPLAIRIR